MFSFLYRPESTVCTTITVYTAFEQTLSSDLTIALTLTPTQSSDEPNAHYEPVIWRILTFKSSEAKSEQLYLYSSRRVTAVQVTDTETISYSDNGAGLGPTQYLSLSRSGKWSNGTLKNVPDYSSFAVNNTGGNIRLAVGSSSPKQPFEPMMLLPELEDHAGVMFRYPSELQAFVISNWQAGQIISLQGLTNIIYDRNIPQAVDLYTLPKSVIFQLYSLPDDTIVLARKDNQMSQSPDPEDFEMVQTPDFASPLTSPNPLSPALSFISLDQVRSPDFTAVLHTPPITPEHEPIMLDNFGDELPDFVSPTHTPEG